MVRKEEKSTDRKRVHVTSRKTGWATKKQGLSKASKVYRTKDSAVRNARKLRTKGHDVVIHRKDGTIQKWEKAKK